MQLSESQIVLVHVLIDNFDLSFDQAKKVLNNLNAEEIFEEGMIKESSKKIVVNVMTKLYNQGQLGVYCYYLN